MNIDEETLVTDSLRGNGGVESQITDFQEAVETSSPEEALMQEEASKDQGFLPDGAGNLVGETASALVGGAADAIESLGGFAELGGDTLKTGLARMFGGPVFDDQDPFSEHYVSGDANWLDIPDHLVPENHSGLGKLARGLTEFGLLASVTGGVGGYTAGAARAGLRIAATARAAGIGAKGVRTIRFLHKGAVIASEGAIADLISDSSESMNIANLVNEHAPWIPFAEALAIDPDKDNPWLARIKTMAAGGGVNILGHALTGYVKGAWAAGKARKAGATVDEANATANEVMDASIKRDVALDEEAALEMAALRASQKRGISHADPREEHLAQYLEEEDFARWSDQATSPADRAALEKVADDLAEAEGNPWDPETRMNVEQIQRSLTQEADPFVNPRKFSDAERSTYRSDSSDPIDTVLREGMASRRLGGKGLSNSPIVSEAQLQRLSMGNANLRQYILEVADELAGKVFKNPENTLDHAEVRQHLLEQTVKMHSFLEDGGAGAAKQLTDYFKGSDADRIIWVHDGREVVTGTSTQRQALELLITSLSKQAEAIAHGAIDLPEGMSRVRQADQVFDAMKVAMTEHKKIGYMLGLNLKRLQETLSPQDFRRTINKGLTDIELKQKEFNEYMKNLAKNGDTVTYANLMEMHRLSGGEVQTIEQLYDYLNAQLRGGRMNGKNISPRIRTEARSVFYNSILSSLKTPIKAIVGTNLIGTLRPFQAYLGGALVGDKTEMLIAASQIDAIGKAFAEGFQMFKHNWDLGVNRQAQTYAGRFDFEKDIQNWKSLKPFYETYGTATQQTAYRWMDSIVDINNNPWMRYSQNGMGAGDALARTIIGRYEMRMKAARYALSSGVDIDNVRAWADKYEEAFRGGPEGVFKQDQHGKWVVSDKAASLAGDEAAMTHALEGNLAGIEKIARISGLRAFFPFVRTGFNALGLSFQHTELVRFTGKWHDIMRGENLSKYGIREQDLAQAQALMRGRKAMGDGIIVMAAGATLAGNMTGDWPRTKEERDLWRLNGIQPNSFKFGNTYISYKDIEPFNTIFAAAANIFSHSEVLGDEYMDEAVEKLVWMTTAVLVDKSMLAGVEDLANVMNAESAGGKLQRTGAKFLRAHLPYSGLLAQVGSIMNANEVEANNMWETIWRRDAVAKSFLHPKYDILSKDRSGTVPYVPSPTNPLLRLFNSLSPVAISYVDEDPVKMGLHEMGFNLPEAMSNYRGTQLSSEARSELSRELQKGNLRQRLEELMRPNGRWRRELNDYKKRGLRVSEGYELYEQRFYRDVTRIFTEEKKRAMQRLQESNPPLALDIQVRQRKRNIGKHGLYHEIDGIRQLQPR